MGWLYDGNLYDIRLHSVCDVGDGMSTLRELSTEMMAINELAKDPEIPLEAIADTMEGIEGLFNDKAVRVVHVIANNDSDIAEIDAEIARLQVRKKTMANAKNRLKEYLKMNMEASGITKIESPLFNISLAKGRQSVFVEDLDIVPKEYVRETIEIAPDKKLIGSLLKKGEEVPGCYLQTGETTVRIK